MSMQQLELSEQDADYVRRCVSEGRYKDASEVVAAGLRLLEEREEEERLHLERLRAEVKKGMDDLEAGRYTEVNSPEELQALFEKIRREATRRLEAGQEHVSTATTQ